MLLSAKYYGDRPAQSGHRDQPAWFVRENQPARSGGGGLGVAPPKFKWISAFRT